MPRALALAAIVLAASALQLPQGAGRGWGEPARVVVGFHDSLPADVEAIAADLGARVLLRVDALAFAVLAMRSEPRALEALAALPGVRYVALDGPVRALEDEANPLVPNPPDDPYWDEQWGARSVHATGAWRGEHGSRSVVVAILDTGIYAVHPDLSEACVDCSADDRNGNGTHVAGIVAASANNGVGIAGLAPGVGPLSVKVLHDAGYGLWSEVAAGIVEAADQGARIVSMSLGGHCEGLLNLALPCTPVEDAVRYAHARGVVLVAAAGNGRCDDCVLWPARYPEVIAVSGSTPEDAPYAYNSRGPEVELSAPAVQVYSTMRPLGSYAVCSRAFEPDPYDCHLTGTSMAAAHVSAGAALLVSHCPGMGNEEARAILRATARDIGAPGWDPASGFGRVDAGRALEAARC